MAMREGMWEGRAGTMDQTGNGRTLASSNSLLSNSGNVVSASGAVVNPTNGGNGGGGGVTSMSMEHPQSLRLKKSSNEKLPPLDDRVRSAPDL